MTSPYDRYRFDPLKTAQEDPDKDRPAGTREFLDAFQLPAEWTRERRIENGYRLRPGEAGQTTHSFGGPSGHSGATCSICEHPLRLVLDIDLKAGDAPAFLKSEFGHLRRLPLYFCFRCPKRTCYRVLSDSTIQTIRPFVSSDYRPETDHSEQSPFYELDIPRVPEKRPAQFQAITGDLHRGMLEAWQAYIDKINRRGNGDLTERTTDALKWLGFEAYYDLPASQIGGLPISPQGSFRRNACTNPECPLMFAFHMFAFHPSDIRGDLMMQPLAVITDDCQFEWQPTYDAIIEYEICPCCLAIRAQYGCT